MQGKPLEQAKAGAKAFLEHLAERDEVTLIFFDSTVYPAVGPLVVGKEKAQLETRIDGTMAPASMIESSVPNVVTSVLLT